MKKKTTSRQQRPSKTAKQEALLRQYLVTPYIGAACKAVGVQKSNHYWWLVNDEAYAKRFREVQSQAADTLIDGLFRAARGHRRLKFDRNGEAIIDPTTGEPYVELERSVTAAIFLLKKLRPEVFGDHVSVDVETHEPTYRIDPNWFESRN